MAFVYKNLRAYGAGSGKTPGIWMYKTEDGVGDLTAAGYLDKDIVPVLNVGDFFFVSTWIDSAVSKTARILVVSARSIKDDGSIPTADLTPIGGYIGDGGEYPADPAGFNRENFGVGFGGGGSSRLFTYRNNTDNKATISADGYFDDILEALQPNDLILCIGSNAAFMVQVTAADTTVTTNLIELAPV